MVIYTRKTYIFRKKFHDIQRIYEHLSTPFKIVIGFPSRNYHRNADYRHLICKLCSYTCGSLKYSNMLFVYKTIFHGVEQNSALNYSFPVNQAFLNLFLTGYTSWLSLISGMCLDCLRKFGIYLRWNASMAFIRFPIYYIIFNEFPFTSMFLRGCKKLQF